MEIGFGGFAFIVFILTLTIYGMSLFVEWGLIKHVMDDPAKGLLASVIGSALIHFLPALFSGHFDLIFLLIFITSLFFALIMCIPSYRRRRDLYQASAEEFEETTN
jgi:hypothetical protein